MITIRIENEGNALLERTGEDEIYAVYKEEYKTGDVLSIAFSDEGLYWVSLDAAVFPALLWCRGTYTLPIPFEEKKLAYSPAAFTGDKHLIMVRKAAEEEKGNYRNLALNPADHHGNGALYPHTFANVETRGESVFASRNAVDGLFAADNHGGYPWSSWGINRNPDAEMTVDFGRPVDISRLVFYNRADFPHDAWWTEGTVTFSDGSSVTLPFVKKDGAQGFSVEKKGVTSLTISHLIKADDPSPFPALVQIEAWGRESE